MLLKYHADIKNFNDKHREEIAAKYY